MSKIVACKRCGSSESLYRLMDVEAQGYVNLQFSIVDGAPVPDEGGPVEEIQVWKDAAGRRGAEYGCGECGSDYESLRMSDVVEVRDAP